MVKLGKYSRSVSIIGVGCTPFMSIVGNPEAEGLTEGELFGYAALEAMQDAGIESQDIDYYVRLHNSQHSRTGLDRNAGKGVYAPL